MMFGLAMFGLAMEARWRRPASVPSARGEMAASGVPLAVTGLRLLYSEVVCRHGA